MASALAAANLHPRQLPSDRVQCAHVLRAAGHTYEAYCLYESALTKEPENFNLLHYILEMDREGGRISYSVQCRLDALKAAPKTRVRAQLCEAYALAVVKKDYREALLRLEPLPPSEPGLGTIRALALGGLGKDDEALAC